MKSTEAPNLQQDNTRVLTPTTATSPDSSHQQNQDLAQEMLGKDHRKPDPKPEELEKPKPYEVTEEQSDNVRKFLKDGITGKFQKLPKDDKAAKPGDKPAEVPRGTKSKAAVKKVAPKPAVRPVAAAEPVDINQVVKTAVEATAAALQPKAAPAAEKPAKYASLSDEDRDEIRILEQMEKSAPAKYKGLVDNFVKAATAAQEYETKWLAAHPGEEFDPEAAEHNEFYKRNDVDWNDRDYIEALTDLKTSKVRDELEGKMTAKEKQAQAETERRETEAKLAPELYREAKQTGREFFTGIGGEYADVVGDDGKVNAELLTKLKDEDPNYGEVVTAANAVEEFAAETFRLFNSTSKYDPDNLTPIQERIVEFARKCEKDMAKFAPEDQLDNEGRRFASNAEFSAMAPKIKAKHWTYGMRELNALWAAEVQQITKNSLAAKEKQFEAEAKRRGLDLKSGTPAVKPAAVKPVQPPEKTVDKPRSPSSGAAPVLARGNGKPVEGAENKARSFLSRAWKG